MPKGLKIPVQVLPTGGTATVDGPENDDKIIIMALGDDTNENPWMQDIGLGPQPVFGINDQLARTTIAIKIRSIFEAFEEQRRYKLVEGSFNWIGPDDLGGSEGELILEFKYVSLEAGYEEPRSLLYNVTRGY